MKDTQNTNLKPKPFNQDFDTWKLVYPDFKPESEKSRESLLAIGNGYIGNRGAMEEVDASDHHYPGTYIAGLYNRLVSKVADRDIENEDFVNSPNWHKVRFRIGEGDWFELSKSKIISINRELDLRCGVLRREMVVEGDNGMQTQIKSVRLVSMSDPHVMAYRYSIKPLNYSKRVEIEAIIDGDLINDGVARYRDLKQQHIVPVKEGTKGELNWVMVETTQSGVQIAEASRAEYYIKGRRHFEEVYNRTEKGKAISSFSTEVKEGNEVMLENLVSIYTSKDDDSAEPLNDALNSFSNTLIFDDVLNSSKEAWSKIWDKMDIRIEGDPKSQMLVRLHLYHLLVTASPHNVVIDAGIPARGLHGEAYRGHIFWDELYILPVFNLFFPDISKSVLEYRYRRLDKARQYAKKYGYAGAMFPWQSGSDGREETQILHLNPISGKWGDDYSSLQRHISIAVAYNIWYYYQTSEDQAFMNESGYETFFEICRFWASKAHPDKVSGRYSIAKVMGPDEFHELHLLSPDGGLKDNAYTNIMVAWMFERAIDYYNEMSADSQAGLEKKIRITDHEIIEWQHISSKLSLNISDEGVISQFDGYFELDELDWDAYRKKYNNIYRLDRILKAEGKSPDEYKLAKQADTLMTYYNLDESTIANVVGNMGYSLKQDALRTNYDYYVNRTSHGSTLSRVVHAYLANQMGDHELGWELYKAALESDYTDIQGGTTAEGIHAGVMGGTVMMVISSFMGINLKHDHLIIEPHLPEDWDKVSASFEFKGSTYHMEVKGSEIEILVDNTEKELVPIEICGKRIDLQTNKKENISY